MLDQNEPVGFKDPQLEPNRFRLSALPALAFPSRLDGKARVVWG
jgi:hypothetical protein